MDEATTVQPLNIPLGRDLFLRTLNREPGPQVPVDLKQRIQGPKAKAAQDRDYYGD